MYAKQLHAHPSLSEYEKLAESVLDVYRSGDVQALQRLADYYELGWLPTWEQFRAKAQQELSRLPDSESRIANFGIADAQYLTAANHGFESWPAIVKYIQEIGRENSPVSLFESAVDAIVTGDTETLERLLRENPELIRARSSREHGATLLHYVAANGVEDYRQKTPQNAVEVAKILLNAGAEVDAD